MEGYYLNTVNSYAAYSFDNSFSPKDVYAKLLREVKEENKEMKDVGKKRIFRLWN